MKKTLFCILASVGMTAPVCSKDFGIMGKTFPIEEESFLSFLQKKLSSSAFSKESAQLVRNKARNPKAFQEIKYAKERRTFLFDPSVRVGKDILDQKGRVVVKKGTVVNPLEQLKLSTGLLLLDGNLESHIKWAKSHQKSFKWILVRGSPIDLEETEKRPVFFDQLGISAHFKVEHYPARITQKGNRLLIEEIPLDHLGNPL